MHRPSSSLYRSLSGLEQTASTNRLLNLASLSIKYADDPDYHAFPMFRSRTLNRSLLLKHRLRPSELATMPRARQTATKVILPFESSELRLGGSSLFVGEPGWLETLATLTADEDDLAHDARVLEALDELPSLDPFLLREHLKRRGLEVSACYFEISPVDIAKMRRFASRELHRLVKLAYKDGGGSGDATARLVKALLSGGVDERFEPLRRTLGMNETSYAEGIFAWRGFLYYKWVLSSLWPEISRMLEQIGNVSASGPADGEFASAIVELRARVRAKAHRNIKRCIADVKLYDNAFQRLIAEADAKLFRDFLMSSPQLFETLGEACGAVSHMATFWAYRFPPGRPIDAEGLELVKILQDFDISLGEDHEAARRPPLLVSDDAGPARARGRPAKARANLG
ncbi:MAG: hypothetical protein ACJ798_01035 [Phenylobacterium sp.]